jgi:uncharacterized membrane protein YhiD involved in acid resistance
MIVACGLLTASLGLPSSVAARQTPQNPLQPLGQEQAPDDTPQSLHQVRNALVQLPLAAALGAALALRPKRRGTPPRTPAVVQTQIMLAVVGAVVMLVVGASLARAFAIVGAANLIRYRSKIDDPKDAVVMLCALVVGLASGVGLYALAAFSTLFMVMALWIIESFEPRTRKHFLLSVKATKDTDAVRPKIEEILAAFRLDFELRTSSDDEVSYEVQVPLEVQTDEVSDRILRLDPEGHASVEWEEKGKKKKGA